MRIGVSIYEVLAQYSRAVEERCRLTSGTIQGPDPRDFCTEAEKRDVLHELARPDFYADLLPTPHAADAMHWLRINHQAELVAFEKPNRYCLGWYDLITDWTWRHFHGLFREVVPVQDPALLALDVVVHCDPEELKRSDASGKLLFDRPWNRKAKGDRVEWSGVGLVYIT